MAGRGGRVVRGSGTSRRYKSIVPLRSPNRSPQARNRARQARKNPSVAEDIVWELLRNRRMGFKFRREYSVLGYRIDFYCAAARLGVEFDGEQHDPDRDAIRDGELAKLGI